MKSTVTGVVVLALLMSAGAALAQSGGFKIVGHAATTPDSASQRELERIFLKKRTKWPDGQVAVPVDQKRTADVRLVFSEAVLHKDLAMVESHWQAQVFSGKERPPRVLASDQEVIDFVRSTPGAVGYVNADTSTGGVTTIEITD